MKRFTAARGKKTICAFVLGLTLASAPAAWADVELDSAEPRVGHTISVAPKSIVLRFREEIDPSTVVIEVTDKNGAQFVLPQKETKGKKHSGHKGEETESTEEKSLIASKNLKPLPPGAYSVRWFAPSDDGGSAMGRYYFTVNPAP